MTRLIFATLLAALTPLVALGQADPPKKPLRYATRTLDEWLEILETDLDTETRQKALTGLIVLHVNGSGSAEEVYAAIIRCLQHDKAWPVRLDAILRTRSLPEIPDARKVKDIFAALRANGPGIPQPYNSPNWSPLRRRPLVGRHSDTISALSVLTRANLKLVSEEALKLLNNKDVGTRILACRLLSDREMPFHQAPTVLPALIRASRDKDVRVRHAALVGLLGIAERSEPRPVSSRIPRPVVPGTDFVGISKEEAINQIIKAVVQRHRDPFIDVRIEAVKGIQSLSPHVSKLLPSMIAELDHQTNDIQHALGQGEDTESIWNRYEPPAGQDLQPARSADGSPTTPHPAYVEVLVAAIAAQGVQADAALPLFRKLDAAAPGTSLRRTIKAAISVISGDRESARSMSVLVGKLRRR